ncbi:MAG: hypothetical protein M3R25_05120 [Bacteroidota bacterium]|nr:hypothetical protein [Bacteroidota bacterium]
MTFCNGQAIDCGHTQIQWWNGTEWVQVAMGTPSGGCLSYTITAAQTGSYQFRAKWNSTGSPASCPGCNIQFNDVPVFVLNVAPCDDCEIEGNTFTGTADAGSCDGTRGATYVVGSEDGLGYVKVQGGLTNFTGANAQVYINGTLVVFNSTSSDGWLTGVVDGYTVGQHTPGGSSNRNIRVTGAIGGCDTLTIHVLWSSTNTGTTITGSWSAKDTAGLDVAPPVDELECAL